MLDYRRIRCRAGSVPHAMDLDPDPGGPKTYGSSESGSATLANIIRLHCTGAHVSARRVAVQLPGEPATAQQGGQAGAGRRNTN